MKKPLSIPYWTLFVSCAWGTISQAHASGYLTARFGSDHGHPALANPFAVYFNPAAMGGTRGTEFVLDATLALRWANYNRSETALSPSSDTLKSLDSYNNANTGKATLFNVVPLPYLGLTSDLGTRNLRIGYAAYIPFGGIASWSKSDAYQNSTEAPGGYDGPQRWHNISGKMFAVYNTAALSYTFEPIRLTVGANVSFIYHSLSTTRARNKDESDDTVQPNLRDQKEGRAHLQLDGANLSAALGLYWEPLENRKLRIGLSYTSQPGFGQTRMRGELRTRTGTGTSETTSQIDLLQTYPDLIRLGAAFRIHPKWELRHDWEYVRWSLFQEQCVVERGGSCPPGKSADNSDIPVYIGRHWRDSVGTRFGAAHWTSDALELFASTGITTPAVPKRTLDASTIDALRLLGTLGAKYKFSERFALAGSGNIVYFFPVDVEGSEIRPKADGRYTSTVFFANVHATFSF